jgi:hypothetical protein
MQNGPDQLQQSYVACFELSSSYLLWISFLKFTVIQKQWVMSDEKHVITSKDFGITLHNYITEPHKFIDALNMLISRSRKNQV